jgi:hypothetical protein
MQAVKRAIPDERRAAVPDGHPTNRTPTHRQSDRRPDWPDRQHDPAIVDRLEPSDDGIATVQFDPPCSDVPDTLTLLRLRKGDPVDAIDRKLERTLESGRLPADRRRCAFSTGRQAEQPPRYRPVLHGEDRGRFATGNSRDDQRDRARDRDGKQRPEPTPPTDHGEAD